MKWLAMEERDRARLDEMLNQLMECNFDEAAWSAVNDALTGIDESLRTGVGDWRAATEVLLRVSSRAVLGTRDLLGGQETESGAEQTGQEPAPPETRELIYRLLDRLGYAAVDSQQADDSA